MTYGTHEGEAEAAALVLTLRTWPTVGDELHTRLVQVFAEGANTGRARTFCARLQLELLNGQKNRPQEAAEKLNGATWIVNGKARAS